MSTLTDTEILQRIDDGSIIISPFKKEQLQNCSYDVCLGEYFYREANGSYSDYQSRPVFNIWSEKQVNKIFSLGNIITREEIINMYPKADFDLLPDGSKIILLQPGETILAHTEEFIGGVKGVTSQMFCRSSMGRSFVTVCKCSGWGDCGYYNRWTMEITNVSQKNVIPLIVGQPIAQIVFIALNTEPTFSYSNVGNYQSQSYLTEGKVDLDRMIKDWTPECMLPKLYRRFN